MYFSHRHPCNGHQTDAGHLLVLGGSLEKRIQMEKKRVWRKSEQHSVTEVTLPTDCPGLWIHLRKTESVNGHSDKVFLKDLTSRLDTDVQDF